MNKPKMFVASSKEGEVFVRSLGADLEASGCVDVLPWYEAFETGYGTLEQLAQRSDEVDFAAFFLLPDDQVRIRDRDHQVARDNVVFEMGLFMGKLDRDRVFALVEQPADPQKSVTLPTDFWGVVHVPFRRKFDERTLAALKAAGRAPAPTLAEVARRLATKIEERGPTLRVPRGVHLVESGTTDRDKHDTISSAIAAARADDVILVRPGTYNESLLIDKPLEIVGVGVLEGEEPARIHATGASAIVYSASGRSGKLASLTIDADGPQDAAVVDIVHGRVLMRGCEVTGFGEGQACVRVAGDANATITANDIVDGRGVGILVCGHGRADITRNMITGHTYSCIEVMDSTNPQIIDNHIGKGAAGGIWLHSGARARIERNDIYYNAGAGIAIDDANPVIVANRINEGRKEGIHVGPNGRGRIEENSIFGNRGSGIEIGRDASPRVESNRIYNGIGGGISVKEGATGWIERNEIRQNQRAGVWLQEGANLERFDFNVIVDGSAEGVLDDVGMERGHNEVERNREDWRRRDTRQFVNAARG